MAALPSTNKKKHTPNIMGYAFKTMFYYLTFQFNRAKVLENDYTVKKLNALEKQDVAEVLDEEYEKREKRKAKIKDSSNRIATLQNFVTYAKNTIYESQIIDILNVTDKIHNKFLNEEDLNIYKLEQFHTYHTDPFIKLIDEAFSDIKNIKIPIEKVNDVITETTTPKLRSRKASAGDLHTPISDKMYENHITNNLFDVIDEKIYQLAQNKLLNLRDTLIINPTSNINEIVGIIEKYKHMPFFKQAIANEMKKEDFVYIGKISENNCDIYVCFINKKQTKLVQYNILTDFPRVVHLNNN